ncbi:MAG: S8 family serine peptidase [Pseudomonadota bacterium]|nr:S8 family serine peptidase [Pseudomonadota bacterium]
MSLGGSPTGSPVVSAINRATAAGVIVVIAAGNDGTDNPDPFAEVANNAAASRGLVIIAGSVQPNNARTPGGDVISTFSDRAGDGAAHYLAAVGEQVRAPDNNNVGYIWSGTSFAAPQISGAIALLAQAFPNLTGAQIVAILFQSARDAGATGVDATYGQGVLDLTRAFQPLGATSVAGTRAPVSLAANAMLSAPMGDAQQGPLGAVILDGFQRAFAIDLARTINRGSPTRDLVGALQSRQRNYVVGVGGSTDVALTIAPARGGALIQRTMLSSAQAEQARVLAGIVTQRLGSHASFAIGFAETGETLTARLTGRGDPAFLVARDPVQTMGFDSNVHGSSAMRQQFGGWGLTAAIESGDALSRDVEALPAIRDRYRRYGYDKASLTLDRRFGALNAALTGTRLAERDTLLGARFSDGLGGTHGTSWFLDAAARMDAGGGWSAGGSLRKGWSIASVRGGLQGSGTIHTDAYAADLGKDGVFGAHDSFGLRMAQPLRVSRGGIDLRLPTGYDYASGAVTDWSTRTLNLAPTGHELDWEVRYAVPLWFGDLQTNLFYRRNPGNFATLPDDKGLAARWSMPF